MVASSKLSQSRLDRLTAIASSLSPQQRLLIAIGLGMANGIDFGTNYAFIVLLPEMEGTIAASLDELSWINTIYYAAMLPTIPLLAYIVNRFGTRRFVLAATLIYGLGSVGCFTASTLPEVLVWRFFQGIGGGAFFVLGVNYIYLMLPGTLASKRVFYLTVWMQVSMVCRALAPLIAGIVRDAATWNWAMLINLPLAIVSASLLLLFMPEFGVIPTPHYRRNLVGVLCFTGGLILLQVVLARGEQWDWFHSDRIYWFFVVAAIAVAVAVWTQVHTTGSVPIFNLRMMTSQRVLSSSLPITVVLGILFGQGLYSLPQYLRTVLTHSATQTGVFFCINGFATSLGGLAAGRLFPKLKGKIIISMGLLFIAASMFWLSYFATSNTPDSYLYLPLVLEGAGVAFMLVGVSSHIFLSEPRALLTDAASIWMWTRRLGQVFASSLFTIYLDHRLTLHSARLNEHVVSSRTQFQNGLDRIQNSLSTHGILRGTDYLSAVKKISRDSIVESRALAYADVFAMIACMCVGSLLFVLLMKNPSQSKPSS